ncbi:P-loop containing nucleoside triphosphate hydrolase protein [Ascobolus immersus RN42]|uniref:P-loop containing nucleoside triphosphate hydrolase protein n=1 Tax=Ascobolus immersus RN42 TaxID=1160509 RepID=A0A3N4IQ14_ASCIM|nr:P-loop containing nucleoside triphosphate hydrolase protein [Ascobolus immersus RN42]
MSAEAESGDTMAKFRQAIRIDLVGDYAGSARFLIHGESLLRHCFSDNKLDFNPGLQLLHAVYIVETFLHNLRRRACVFDIVFINSWKDISIPSGKEDASDKYLLARSILIKHLQELADPDMDVRVYDTPRQTEFLDWLQATKHLFIMAFDAEHWERETGEEDEPKVEEPTPEQLEARKINNVWRTFMHLVEKYPIAFVNKTEFVDSKVFTYVIEATTEISADEEDSEEEAPVSPYDGPEFSNDLTFREQIILKALWCYFKDTGPEHGDKYAAALLAHVTLLESLSLKQRVALLQAAADSQAGTESDPEAVKFISNISTILTRIVSSSENALSLQITDIIDGLLFNAVLSGQTYGILKSHEANVEKLADALEAELTTAGISASVRESLRGIIEAETPAPADDLVEEAIPRKASVLPFRNPIFDPHLKAVRLIEEEEEQEEKKVEEVEDLNYNDDDSDASGVSFRETQHWHNDKPLTFTKKRIDTRRAVPKIVPAGQTLTTQERRQMGRAFRSDQKYSSAMQKYAASLTDSVGASLEPRLIITQEAPKAADKGSKKAPEKKVIEKKPAPEKKGKPGAQKKAPKLSKAEEIKLANASKGTEKDDKVLRNAWAQVCNTVKSTKDLGKKLYLLEDYRKRLLKKHSSDVGTEPKEWQYIELDIRLYKIMLLQYSWTENCKAGKRDVGLHALAKLYDEARFALQSPALTEKAVKLLTTVFEELGMDMPPRAVKKLYKKDIGFQTTWTGSSKTDVDSKVGMTAEEFQLVHCGQTMDRNMDSQPDPRVPFEPDAWQRKVLDEIDARNSVFVVAPTSAGKTFISFHAMEQVLKSDDDGILVYVAPTKALVNQIAAEVISRFRKNYKHGGKTVWAIHTRDYRIHKPEKCQILITVPHILSIMLLSPSNAKVWAPRLKWIIFDEVHSIGNADDGVVWEQLLLLAPCPIIALSATVGNPKDFMEWLQSSQNSRGNDMEMIVHEHRYSDLSKYIHHPKKDEIDGKHLFTGFEAPNTTSGSIANIGTLQKIHPLASITDAAQGIPEDLSMEPKDCLVLYQCMKELETPEYPVPNEVGIDAAFGKGNVIRKVDVIKWETKLKALLKKYMADQNYPFQKLVEKLEKASFKLESGESSDPQLLDEATRLSDDELYASTLPLLSQLHKQNALPAILFSFDRTICNNICETITKQLEEGEAEWRKNNPKWKAKLKDWEAWKKSQVARHKKAPKKGAVEPGTNKAEALRSEAEAESSLWESFNPEDPSSEFSFADPVTSKFSMTELESEIKWLAQNGIHETFLRGLRRGVGVHHAGMNRKYRQTVEVLFRKGFLRVVVATGTLALGINMPCKTVIFAGDSLYLSALNYRQAAGRAGRRGFDLIGNVIFHGLPTSRVRRLISSRLPSLIGHFPISISLVLRLFILLHNSGYSEHAKKSVESLLTQPRLVLGGESFKEQVVHHLRFSIEYLRQHKLLQANGAPYNFAGLVSHLYYIESSAFAFHALLCSGHLQKVCADVDNVKSHKQLGVDLMLIMAHLFGRRPPLDGSGAKGVLPPLPEEVRRILEDDQEKTRKIYCNYVETYAEEYCKENEDNTLPFSGQAVGNVKEDIKIPGASKLNPARSHFVALSRNSGEFKSIPDLVDSVRSDIYLEGSSVPFLDFNPETPLNSYLLNFYKNGDQRELLESNGIGKSEIWFLLKDFSLVLAVIITALQTFIKSGDCTYFDIDEGASLDEDGEAALPGDEDENIVGEEDEEVSVKASRVDYRKVLAGLKVLRDSFEEKFKAIYA